MMKPDSFTPFYTWQSMQPKVQLPFFIAPGLLPRKIEIEK